MKAGRSVQFKQVDDILTAYMSRKVAPFSIFQEKQFLFKYEGESMEEGCQELETMCNALRQSAAIYTLAVYEDLPGGKLKSDTPYDGSFNFRFQDNFEPYNNTPAMFQTLNANLVEMNKKYDLLLADRENDKEEVEESSMDKIAGFLSHPLVQQFAPAILGALGIRDKQLAGMAGVSPHNPNYGHDVSPQLYNALCEMMIVVPDTEKHLIVLGKLAKENPEKFKSIMVYMKLL